MKNPHALLSAILLGSAAAAFLSAQTLLRRHRSLALIASTVLATLGLTSAMLNRTISCGMNRRRRRLVLIGGGHAHAQVIKAMNKYSRPEDVDVILIDPQLAASYSGMVPACVAGLYNHDQTLLHLKPIAEAVGIEFLHSAVINIDPLNQILTLKDGTMCDYDVVSFDVGSVTRGHDSVKGVRDYAIPTRPISDLVRQIQAVETNLPSKGPVRVAVVGGGGAGVELSFAIKARWASLCDSVEVTILDRSDALLSAETPACRRAVERCLDERGIRHLHGQRVQEVQQGQVLMSDGTTVSFDHLLWATGAQSQPLAEVLTVKDVKCTVDGWVRVNPALQSVAFPNIFAAGDCAQIEGLPNGMKSPPKAGVYAVRAGPVLIENLTRALDNPNIACEDLKQYVPQSDFLKLFVCGDGTGIGFRFGRAFTGPWVWKLKDHIDKSFMDLFSPASLDLLKDESRGQTYDTAQYDAAEFKTKLSPPEAAALLARSDAAVDYMEAWNVLRVMMADQSFQSEVLKHLDQIQK